MIERTQQGEVAILTLAHGKANTLDVEFCEAIAAAFKEIEASSARAVVMSSGDITPMATRTRLVFLMHPKEHKHEKAATGRLTHLCLANITVSQVKFGIPGDSSANVFWDACASVKDGANGSTSQGHSILPAPGAVALLGIAGFTSRRRRG